MKRYDDPSAHHHPTAAPARAKMAQGPRLRPARSMLALETRIVFDGAVAAAALADPHDAAAGGLHQPAIAGRAIDAGRASAEAARAAALAPERAPVEAPTRPAGTGTIVFVDASVNNPQTLLAGLKPGVEVVMLDKNRDGVQQIADALKGRHDLDSIQILSEGSTGRIILGSSVLSDHNIDSYQTALANWGAALRSGGDILLYGCNVADNATGEHFVNRLAQLTGADIAASTDATGAAALGGNWVLEKHTGSIEADKAISERALADYAGLLLTGNGTADGTYDFGGSYGSASGGFRPLADKLKISDFLAQDSNSLYASTAPYLIDGGVMTAIFKAEGGTVAKTFTFNDFAFSVTSRGAGNNFRTVDQLQVVLADTAGNTIATLQMTGPTVVLSTTGNSLSSLINGGAAFSYANVASVSITISLWKTTDHNGDGGAASEINFTSMTMSNISAGPVNTAPVFVGVNTALTLTQNAGATDIKGLLHVNDADVGQTETWSQALAPQHGSLNFSGATGSSGSADITPGGTITYTPTAGYAGTDSFTIRVSDGAGGVVDRTITVNVTPSTPGTPDLAAASDSGSSNTDNLTNAGSLTFSGTSAAGDSASTVRVFLDVNGNGTYDAGTDVSATAIVNNGAWTVTGLSTNGVADGAYNVYAITTAAGTLSSTRSAGLAVTIDKTVPGTPSNPIVLSAASDSGASSSDRITNVTNPTVRLSLAGTNAVSGDTAELLLGGASLGTPVRLVLSGTDISNGYIDLTVTSGDLGADGSKVFAARVTDRAGNVGTAGGALTITLDTSIAAPSLPLLSAASDSGSSNSDRLTNVTTPIITGTAEAGSTVTLYDTNGTTVLGTAIATGGSWSITSSALGNGLHSLTAKAVDAAGNISAASGALSITIDTTLPGAPANPITLLSASDSGASSSDGITNISNPAVRISLAGTNAVSGDTLELLLGGNSFGTPMLTTLNASDISNGYVDMAIVSGSLGADGSKVLTSRVTDIAGNVGTAGGSFTVRLDTTRPGTPGTPIIMAASSDSGSSNSDHITNVTNPLLRISLAGTSAVAGDMLELLLGGNSFGMPMLATLSVTNISNGYIDMSIVSGSLGADGAKVLTSRVTDIAGNVGTAGGSFTITLDTTIAAPSVPVLAGASDSGSSNSDRLTNVITPVITGTAEAGSTVTLYDTNGTSVLGTAVATGGVWSITSSALGNGTHTLTAKAVDTAGNVSVASGSLAVTIDTTAPAPPPAPTLDPASDSGASNSDHITRVTTPVINGTAESGSTVTLYDSDGSTILGTSVATGGVWSITSSALADGVHNLSVKATDTAGNSSAASGVLAVTIATVGVAPGALTLDAASDSGISNADRITRINTPTISGTALAGSIVTLYDSGGITVLGTAVATGGVWSITSSTLGQGVHALTAKAFDAVGNTSPASVALNITIDLTAPSAPSTPTLDSASDSGASNTDGITGERNLLITGTAENGSIVTLYDSDGTTVIGTTIASGGAWSISTSALADGVHTLRARASDAAGNISAASGMLSVTVDTSVAAPSTPALTSGNDTGASNSDGITNINNQVISGTAEAGSAVTLYDGAAVVGTTIATGGVWSFNAYFGEGRHNLSAKAVDIAGNVSLASDTLVLVIDNSAPAAPGIPVLDSASDSGAADGITSVTTPVITGTAEAGSTVTLYDTDGVTVLGTTVATGGAWSITSNTLGDGNHTLTVKATDTAGNTSAVSSALNITVDTALPGAPNSPLVLAAASDSGSSNSDGITNISNPTVRVSLGGTNAAAGDVAELLLDNAALGTPARVTLSATDISNGYIDITVTSGNLGADGPKTLTARVTDVAGNVGTAGGSLTITLDTAIATPPAPVLDSASDSGAADGITRITTPTISGTAEAGSTVTLYDTDGVTVLGTTVATGGAWSITSNTLGDGNHTLTVKATDTAGNSSAVSSALSITIDTALPGAPSSPLVLAAASDSGSLNSDGITNISNPTVRVSLGSTNAAAGDVAELLLDNAALGTPARVTLSATDISNGYIDISVASGNLGADGQKTLTARVTDVAGNTGAAGGSLTITLDTAIATPPAPVLDSASDSGAADGITRITRPVITGTAEAGSTVTLYDTDGVTVLGTTVATGGVWSITSSNLGDGVHSLTVKATDTAGNSSAISSALSITVDTALPGAPSSPLVLAAASDSGSSNSDGITNVSNPTVRVSLGGTNAAAGDVAELLLDNASLGTPARVTLSATDISNGYIDITVASGNLGADGPKTLTARVTDVAGNVGTAGGSLTITLDTAIATPPAPVLDRASDSGAADGITRITTPTISGTAEAGSTVTLYDTDGVTVLGTTVATGGAWSITSNTLGDGNHTLTVKATDTAGNTSAVSSALSITIDTALPGAPSSPLVLAAASDSGSSNSDGITNISNPTVRISLGGTNAAAGDVAELLLDNAALGTPARVTLSATDISNGYIDITVASGNLGADGSKTLTARVTDVAGNTGTAGGSLTITLDTAIATPPAPVLDSASDSGAADGITRITTPVITGTAEAGSTVTLYDTDGVTVLGTTVATGGAWSITSNTLGDGNHTLTVKATDTAGNTSAVSSALNITIDTALPGAPSSPLVLAAASDSGSLNSDGVTNISNPTVRVSLGGTNAAAGDVAELLLDNAALGTPARVTLSATDISNGYIDISVASGNLGADGQKTLTARVTDVAGNTGAAGGSLTITLDTAIATPPTPVLDSASDSGAADGITRITTPTISGTAEAGSTVTLYDTDGVTVLGTAVATGGRWSITSSNLGDGSHTLTVKATDTAGNTSAISSVLNITIDSSAPAAPPAPQLSAGSDSGVSNSDGITNVSRPTITGRAESGSTITLYDSDGVTVLGTTVATGGAWSITSSTLGDGVHSLTAKATDTAGNASAASSVLNITIDSSAPAAPPAPVLSAGSDSGVSNSDGITNVSRPTITGRAESGSTVTLYDSDGVTVLGTNVATGGLWSITSTTLGDGVHSLTAKATDTAGNASATSSVLNITIDSSGPAAPPAPQLSAGSDSGVSNSDGITNVSRPTITGRAENGSTVTLYDSDGVTVLGTTVATGGVWSITSTTLGDGVHSLTAKATDTAGNASAASSVLNITLDSSAPATPPAPQLSADSDSGVSNSDGITNVTRPTITGRAENGSTVTLFDSDGVTVLGTAVATGGVWSITSTTLGDGVHSLTAKATDTAGNASATSSVLNITIDSSAPAAPPAPQLSAGSDSGVSNSDGITNVSRPTITGRAENGSTVTLYDSDGVTVLGTTVATGGTWNITSSTLGDGVHSLTAKATDTAGNASAASSVLNITIDRATAAAPPTPALSSASDSGLSDSDSITNVNRPTITGRADSGSTITLYDSDGVTVLGTTVAAGGAWSITSSALGNGSHSLSVRATDTAGNTSVASAALTIVIDASVPATPDTPQLVGGGTSTTSTTPVFNGNAEANSSVTVRSDGVVIGTAQADAGGKWSLGVTLPLGVHQITATATDAAGNSGTPSRALSLNVVAPPIPVTTRPPLPAPPVLAPAPDVTPVASPPIRDAALGQISMSPLAAVIEAASGQTDERFGTAPPPDNPYTPLPPIRTALVLNREISNLSINPQQGLNLSIPRDTFISADGSRPTLTAHLADGRPLPSWIHFDPLTGTFTGKPPAGEAATLEIEIVAKDAKGNEVKTVFKLHSGKREAAPPQASLSGNDLLLALGLSRRGGSDTLADGGATLPDAVLGALPAVAQEALEASQDAPYASALSGQLAREAQRFARDAGSTLRHLAQL